MANTSGGEIERNRTAKSTKPNNQNLGLRELFLPLCADIRHQHMAAVAHKVVMVQCHAAIAIGGLDRLLCKCELLRCINIKKRVNRCLGPIHIDAVQSRYLCF